MLGIRKKNKPMCVRKEERKEESAAAAPQGRPAQIAKREGNESRISFNLLCQGAL